VPGLTHWQHPSFFAYFPVAATFEGMLADLYASSTANPGFNVGFEVTFIVITMIKS
jgi:aromatic-L-amino-acid decarboxylase